MNKQHSTKLLCKESREERERLQVRYNELGLSMVMAQEELEEARTRAGANAVATASMTRQIEVLVEDQILRRHELDVLRRQLDASTTSALEAQSRLQAHPDRSGRPSMTSAAPTYSSYSDTDKRSDHSAPSVSCMLTAATEDIGASDRGIGTTTVRIDHIDHHPGDPGIATGTVGIDLNVRRPPDDLGTGPTSAKTDPRDYPATGDPGTRGMTTGSAVIEQGLQGIRVHHPTHLFLPIFRLGNLDWDRGWRPSQEADGRTR